MPSFVVGVDIGKVQDSTAAVVLDRLPDGHINGVGLWRSTPNDAYATQAAAVVDLVERYRQYGPCAVYVDVTNGIGTEAVTLFDQQLRAAGVSVWFVHITGGIKTVLDSRTWRVPKSDLVGALQVVTQRVGGGDPLLRMLAANPAWGEHRAREHMELRHALLAEMGGFKMTAKDSGRVSYDNDVRVSKHDDLVLGLAIGVWAARLPSGAVGRPVADPRAPRTQVPDFDRGRGQSWRR